jgi:hypothetical protein
MKRPAQWVPVAVVAVLAGIYFARPQQAPEHPVPAPAAVVGSTAGAGASTGDPLRQAFTARRSSIVLRVAGRVERTLADDRDGSPHQRFILDTDSGISVLIAHNLALAPRLDGLSAGDQVEVLGEYEWNEKGGVMHWTHHDPQGRHPTGFIEWRGRRYQ